MNDGGIFANAAGDDGGGKDDANDADDGTLNEVFWRNIWRRVDAGRNEAEDVDDDRVDEDDDGADDDAEDVDLHDNDADDGNQGLLIDDGVDGDEAEDEVDDEGIRRSIREGILDYLRGSDGQDRIVVIIDDRDGPGRGPADFTREELDAVARAIAELPRLFQVELSFGFSSPGVATDAVKPFLRSLLTSYPPRPTFRFLDVGCGPGLDGTHAAIVADAMRSNTNITILNLTNIAWDRAGAQALADILAVNAILETLTLNFVDTGFGVTGSRIFAAALADERCPLNRVYLDFAAPADEEGMNAIAAALHKNGKIVILGLGKIGNGTTHRSISGLLELLRRNKTLHHVTW